MSDLYWFPTGTFLVGAVGVAPSRDMAITDRQVRVLSPTAGTTRDTATPACRRKRHYPMRRVPAGSPSPLGSGLRTNPSVTKFSDAGRDRCHGDAHIAARMGCSPARPGHDQSSRALSASYHEGSSLRGHLGVWEHGLRFSMCIRSHMHASATSSSYCNNRRLGACVPSHASHPRVNPTCSRAQLGEESSELPRRWLLVEARRSRPL